ncbi:hypothetical protein AC579_9798 [Pseudocercospora musae]|uniref:Uncharacterized protein n=1 Tax=Pseudocercospora musae TaxID=113226 RepID=A0A139IVD7_9PEZI|nr:hypothetical protein AC579_9798 [Pseudocercospora musae]
MRTRQAISTSVQIKVTSKKTSPSEASYGIIFEIDKRPQRFFGHPANMSPLNLHTRRSYDLLARPGLLICTLGAAFVIALCYTAVVEFDDSSASPFPELRTRHPHLSCCLSYLGMMVKSSGAITSALLLILIAPVIVMIGLELYKAYQASVCKRDATRSSNIPPSPRTASNTPQRYPKDIYHTVERWKHGVLTHSRQFVESRNARKLNQYILDSRKQDLSSALA